MGMPVTNGFIGELFILIGAFKANWIYAIPVVLGVLFSAAYLLWLFQRVFLGDYVYRGEGVLRDLGVREKITAIPFVILIFWIGIYPKPFLKVMDVSLNNLVERIERNSQKAVAAYGYEGRYDSDAISGKALGQEGQTVIARKYK
jgi:NADH-quinone oxidoreductase subunit M